MLDRSLSASLAALCLVTAFAVPAFAEDPPAAPAAAPASAQELRDKARVAMTSGDVAGACLLFEESYQAALAPGSAVSPEEALFALASCQERAGKIAAATAEFAQVAAGNGPRSAEAKQRAAQLAAPTPPAQPASP